MPGARGRLPSPRALMSPLSRKAGGKKRVRPKRPTSGKARRPSLLD